MINDYKEEDSPFDDIKFERAGPGRISGMAGRLFGLERGHLLQAAGAVLQVLLGIATIVLSLIGLIQPAWISTLMSILGSLAIITGTALLISAIIKKPIFQSLISQAIRRVIESQN